LSSLFLALLIGGVFVVIAELIRRSSNSNNDQADQLFRLGNMQAKGLTPDKGEQTVTLTKSMLEEALAKANESSFPPFLQNFCWFTAGSIISVFANDIRVWF